MSIFPTKVLLATDGSEEATLAASTASGLATRTGSELHVLTIGPEYPYFELPDAPARFEEVVEAQRREAKEILDDQVRKIEDSGGTVEEAHLEMGVLPGRTIVHLGERLGAGLIIVGSRGLGPMKRAVMGSVSSSVVHHAHCPVLVVRGERDYLQGRILLALDGSRESSAAAGAAVELAGSMDSELHVVHVGEVNPVYHPERRGYLALYKELQERARRLLDEQVNEVEAAGGTVVKAHLRMGRPDEEIVVLGEEIAAQLIVTGSRGLGGIRRALMGSVSDSVVSHAHCPVMVVRREGEK
ncbi:MAG TPA: universal stress protein [Rubrobacter sp.]|nr:universal stress protein [Rubrobacter sp.]